MVTFVYLKIIVNLMKTKIRDLILGMFPDKFKTHYIIPLFTSRKSKEPIDSKKFFESYHNSVFQTSHSDQLTISKNTSYLQSKFHYNAVENSIIQYLTTHSLPTNPTILDVGSGTGHWIDFYLKALDPSMIVGNEISEPAAIVLKAKYESIEKKNVRVVGKDISEKGLKLQHQFDLINAIGVMFHIVEDNQWEQALLNLKNHLTDDGIIIIGGQFGMLTQNIGFSNSNHFQEKDKSEKWNKNKLYINKRIRSLRFWKKAAKQNGLQVGVLIKTQQNSKIHTPENNILVLKKV